jgi:8-oxo-dGTP diphosphatase
MAAEQLPAPLLGVGVLIFRDGKLLLGRRRGAHGAGSWAPPGGHLEPGESVEECARREAREETGLEIENVRPAPWTHDRFPAEGKEYVTLFVTADAPGGEPGLREPDKCAGWEWHAWQALPAPLFAPLGSLRRSGYDPAREAAPGR